MIPIQNILQEYFRLFVQNVTEIYINKSKTFFFIVALLSANPNSLKKALDLQLHVNYIVSITVITTNFSYSTRTVQFAFIA